MTPFYYNDEFFVDLETFLESQEIDEDNVDELPDDWHVIVMECDLEKMFQFTKDEVFTAFSDRIEVCHEERFPEDADNVWKKIEKAVAESVNLELLNSLIPSVWYAADREHKITKADIISHIK